MTVAVKQIADTPENRMRFQGMMADYAQYMRTIGNNFFRVEEDGRISPSPDREGGDVIKDAFELPGSFVHFITSDGRVLGFAWMTTRAFPHHRPDRDVNLAEFWIDPVYRRKGVGHIALRGLLDQYTGEWVIAMIKTNKLALSFWPKVIEEAAGTRADMSEPTIEQGDDDIRYRFIIT